MEALRSRMDVGMKFIVLLMLICLTWGCAYGHCRKQQIPKIAPTVVDEAKAQSAQTSADPSAAPIGPTRVMVFKYDGSLQCKPGSGLTVEKMAKELKGIKIYSSEKKADGLMHIQVCGSITGMANVYEISSEQLTKAEKLGFKKWSFE